MTVLQGSMVIWVNTSSSQEPEMHINANSEGNVPVHLKSKVQEQLSGSNEGKEGKETKRIPSTEISTT